MRIANKEKPCKTGSQCIGGKCQECDSDWSADILYKMVLAGAVVLVWGCVILVLRLLF